MVDSVVVVTFLAVVAGIFLMFRRESGRVALRGDRADAIAKYVIATFLGTYASVGAAALLFSPVLLYERLSNSQTAE